MIRLVSRIVILVVLSLTLSGCLRMLDTAPLLPTPPTGGVAVNPTNSVSVPTVAATLPSVPPTDTPTLEQPTNAPTVAVQASATLPLSVPVTIPATVPATIASANVQTQQPTLPPPPTNTVEPPTATPVIPTNTAPPPPPTSAPTVAPSETPAPVASATPGVEASATTGTGSEATDAAATLTAAAPTPTATNTFAVTLAPPIDGASGTIDAQCNYKIEQNDHLYAIGRRFNRTIQELLKANPSIVNPQLIFLGQIMKIPDCTTR